MDKNIKMMNPKMKGLFKGLRYISNIFEEEKEEEFQIGMPTDVKHVAHIGSDGPANEAPSWMREFKAGEPAPSDAKEDDSEGSKRRTKSQSRDAGDVPRPSRHRRNSSESNSAGDSPPKKRDPSSKSRTARRSKDSSEGSSLRSRQLRESATIDASGNPIDVPKRTRVRRKANSVGNPSTRSRKSAGTNNNASTDDDGAAPGNE